jgi:hypothetical protein
MESLKRFFVVFIRGEPDCKPFRSNVDSCCQNRDVAVKIIFAVVMNCFNISPEQIFNLILRGCCGYSDPINSGAQPPMN